MSDRKPIAEDDRKPIAEDDREPIAEDVREAYRESDVPERTARDRAADAERKAERSGQAGESPDEGEKGTGTLEP